MNAWSDERTVGTALYLPCTDRGNPSGRGPAGAAARGGVVARAGLLATAHALSAAHCRSHSAPNCSFHPIGWKHCSS